MADSKINNIKMDAGEDMNEDMISDDEIYIVQIMEDDEQQKPLQQPERKLNMTDEEKRILVNFYKENPILWDSIAFPRRLKNREEKNALRRKMFEIFGGKYTIEVLERTFHVLRTSMLREVKTADENGMQLSDKKWKFYDDLLFLRDVLKRGKNKRTTQVETEDSKQIIAFYRHNQALLEQSGGANQEYRDELLNQLSAELDRKYSIKTIKSHFDSLMNIYKREKRWLAKYNKGKPLDPSFISAWEFYNDMELLEEDQEVSLSMMGVTTKQENMPPSSQNQKIENLITASQKTVHHNQEQPIRASLLHQHHKRNLQENHQQKISNSLTASSSIGSVRMSEDAQVVLRTNEDMTEFDEGGRESYTFINERNQVPLNHNNYQRVETSTPKQTWPHHEATTSSTSATTKPTSPPSNDFKRKRDDDNEQRHSAAFFNNRSESALRFGQVVADSLMQCDVKDWPRLKKQVMDLFFEYEVEKSN